MLHCGRFSCTSTHHDDVDDDDDDDDVDIADDAKVSFLSLFSSSLENVWKVTTVASLSDAWHHDLTVYRSRHCRGPCVPSCRVWRSVASPCPRADACIWLCSCQGVWLSEPSVHRCSQISCGFHITSYDMHVIGRMMIEGSLEVKLPTIWTDEKQRWEE